MATKRRTGKRGDWMTKEKSGVAPWAKTIQLKATNYEDVYETLEGSDSSAFTRAMKDIQEGKAVVDDAVLFCGRFNEDGKLLRESTSGAGKPYRLVRVRGHREYTEAMKVASEIWKGLPAKAREARETRAERRQREAAERKGKTRGRPVRESPFTSSSDIGSTYQLDPNQFTEYTPYFNGPFAKQQYFDYFMGHARAFEEFNHNPVAKRIVDLLVQYGFGRGFKVRCNNDEYSDKWNEFNRANRITHKLRKYWMREYLIYGENFIDKLRWISVDPSTIYDIVCEGFDEFIDKVLYYQQMFQTATQMYAGISVPGVPKSKDSKTGHYIIRQIPADQLIHIKCNVTSGEKRGRSILYSVLGWLKRLSDTLNAQVLGEQLRASFVWDDTVVGDQGDVDAHGARYNYIPVAPSIFVHNEAVTRKPLAPMQGVTAGATNVVQEILALIATAVGLPKEHLNVMMSSGSNRATAAVGSEPFTKVIEDFQEDGSDLIHQIIEAFCQQNKIDYDEDDWEVVFPSVQKDALNDRLKAIATCEEMGWFSPERAATMAASEMEADNYAYDSEMKKKADNAKQGLAMGMPGRFGPPATLATIQGQNPSDSPEDNPRRPSPIHGAQKKAILRQGKKL